eukprot:CFRG5431T1
MNTSTLDKVSHLLRSADDAFKFPGAEESIASLKFFRKKLASISENGIMCTNSMRANFSAQVFSRRNSRITLLLKRSRTASHILLQTTLDLIEDSTQQSSVVAILDILISLSQNERIASYDARQTVAIELITVKLPEEVKVKLLVYHRALTFGICTDRGVVNTATYQEQDADQSLADALVAKILHGTSRHSTLIVNVLYNLVTARVSERDRISEFGGKPLFVTLIRMISDGNIALKISSLLLLIVLSSEKIGPKLFPQQNIMNAFHLAFTFDDLDDWSILYAADLACLILQTSWTFSRLDILACCEILRRNISKVHLALGNSKFGWRYIIKLSHLWSALCTAPDNRILQCAMDALSCSDLHCEELVKVITITTAITTSTASLLQCNAGVERQDLSKLSNLLWILTECYSKGSEKKTIEAESQSLLKVWSPLHDSTDTEDDSDLNDDREEDKRERNKNAVSLAYHKDRKNVIIHSTTDKTRLELELELVNSKMETLRFRNSELENSEMLAQQYKHKHFEQSQRLEQSIQCLMKKNNDLVACRNQMVDVTERLTALQNLHESRETELRLEVPNLKSTLKAKDNELENMGAMSNQISNLQKSLDEAVRTVSDLKNEIERTRDDALKRETNMVRKCEKLVEDKRFAEERTRGLEERLCDSSTLVASLQMKRERTCAQLADLEIELRHAHVHAETLQAEAESGHARANKLEVEVEELRRFRAFIHNLSGGALGNVAEVVQPQQIETRALVLNNSSTRTPLADLQNTGNIVSPDEGVSESC